MKFIHAADIHLDSPFVGLEQYDGAPIDEIRGASRKAFRNLVDLAISDGVSIVLLAGDLYDGDWKDYNTGLFFTAQMTKLREAGIRVIVIAGNHDAASQITRHLRMPDNVKWLSVQKPESVVLEDFGMAVHGQGFPSRAVTDDLSEAYPEAISSLFNIGLLHTGVNGRQGHDLYAPCSVQGLLSKGYNYWALGHIHKREILHENPWILFPGNLQGRNVRETGPKGCTLVTIQDGMVHSIEHHDLDVLRWSVCEVDSSGTLCGEDIVDRVALALQQELVGSDGRPLAVRVQLVGHCKAHREFSANIDHWTNEIRAHATDISNGAIWIEKVKDRTHSKTEPNEMAWESSAMGSLLQALQDLDMDEQLLANMAEEFNDLQRKLPAELRTGNDAIDLHNPQTFQDAIEDVRQLLTTRILSVSES
ncbi:MAG: DNA repair exonuclease [Chloroflexota bacterium]|nr:DNA repair exonuclease [Chloroflexota bacterium]